MPVIEKVAGYCPMGCGPTLFLGDGGHVTCSLVGCPSPCAVDQLLADPEHEHVVRIDDEGFSVQHPLRERLDGELFDCTVHADLRALGGPPEEPGRYRVTRHLPDAVSEDYRPGPMAGWDFEPLGDPA